MDLPKMYKAMGKKGFKDKEASPDARKKKKETSFALNKKEVQTGSPEYLASRDKCITNLMERFDRLIDEIHHSFSDDEVEAIRDYFSHELLCAESLEVLKRRSVSDSYVEGFIKSSTETWNVEEDDMFNQIYPSTAQTMESRIREADRNDHQSWFKNGVMAGEEENAEQEEEKKE